MSPAHSPFVRRANTSGTTDSICTRCYATVASAMWEIDLDRAERAHICDPHLVEHWKEMARRNPADGWDQKPPSSNRPKSAE
ncbi:MAG TPA: hypothetical protein VGR47_05720 [Terracidiphilus sp.]|nr:hypothetical protein [Terracidiphilus sp.]